MTSADPGSDGASIRSHLAAAEAALRQAGSSPENARIDADVLARHVLGWDRATLLVRRDEPMPADAVEAFGRLMARRQRREPVAYLTGGREFYGRDFLVTPSVLIPRPESELVIDYVLRQTPRDAPLRIVDVGTGSGILAVTLACERPSARVLATDISGEALDVARRNARTHGVEHRLTFAVGDLLQPAPGPFDVIVANPPYVAQRDAPGLSRDVREYEPAVALFGGDDGLTLVRRLVGEAAARLAPGGLFVMEFGAGQGYDVAQHVSDAGFGPLEILEDLQGIERVVAGRLRELPLTTASLPSTPSLVRGLGLFATIAVVISNVIGTGVFLKARVMACHVDTPVTALLVWVATGLLALAGALTYAELSAMMPRAGGEYVFIREAYGRLWAFLYGWMRFFVGTTGGQAGLAAGFAIFMNGASGGRLGGWHSTLFLPGGWSYEFTAIQAVAIAAIAAVTLINCAAVSVGGRVGVVFTVLKLALVLGVGLTAFLLVDGSWQHFTMSSAAGTCSDVEASARGGAAGFGAAMMAALWAYNGWNEVTYVAGEVRDPSRTLPFALIGGVLALIGVYSFVNAGYAYVLSPVEMASVSPDSAVASEVMARVIGPGAAGLMAATLAVSVFSALHMATLVGARVPYAMAEDGLFFRGMAAVSPRTHVPVRALVVQGIWASILVLSGSFDTLTNYSIFAVLIFVGLATAAVFILRRTRPEAERPYRTWGYPVVPAVVLLVTGWLIVNTLLTMPYESFGGLALMALGLPAYWLFTRTDR